MKKILSIIVSTLLIIIGFASCSEDSLNTSPTTQIASDKLFTNVDQAKIPLDGIYRLMYTPGWSTGGNTHQCFGISAYALTADVMGDDHIMSGQGSGWFWYDCIYKVKQRFESTSWRSYDLWNTYYTYISNANYIIASKDNLQGASEKINQIIGEAYAIRAYSYFMLAQWFCRTYVGHENDPGVPIYTDPTDIHVEGKPRKELKDVYVQINADIDTAINRLENGSGRGGDKSHIDKYVAYGIKARICLVEEDWEGALDAAQNALGGPAKLTADILSGMNNIEQADVMWGAKIKADQSSAYASFFMHMDHKSPAYGNAARKQINKALYNLMGKNDIRRNWWDPKDPGNKIFGYQQTKFRWKNLSDFTGDYFWMRVPEMYLTAAEALCMLGEDGEAQNVLNDFMKKYRNPAYNTDKTGKALGSLTSDMTGSLREEIIIQRRIELWGEYGRIFDIRRLKQGFIRTQEQGWPEAALLEGLKTGNPESWDWVMTIPQTEFDNNDAMDLGNDQNPIGSGI